MTDKKKFATRAIHAGQEPDPTTGAIMPPIYATSTYVQESPGKHKGYEYSRTQNPTRMAYERCVADLESGQHGFAFASGMAATGTILELIDSGAKVVAMDDLYGGTRRLFSGVRERSAGLRFEFVDLSAGKDTVHAATFMEVKVKATYEGGIGARGLPITETDEWSENPMVLLGVDGNAKILTTISVSSSAR